VTTASTAQALAPLRGQPVIPEKAEADPAAISKPHFTIGGGVQYRSGQSVRPLISMSSTDFRVPWGVASFQGTGGTENTNGVGALNLQNDYIGFAKLHHRLGLSFAGKTDSTANRLLGSNAEINERKTGGQGRLEYDAVNDWHGMYVQLFGQGARQNLSFSGGGTDLPNAGLWTADAGATIDVLHEARPWPGRFEIAPAVHFGDQTAVLAKPYTIWSLDVSAHQRISDFKLISVDISGHFRDATRDTPVFELPSLGGGESLRGFRPDDVLPRRYWSLQNELWVPVPGTLSASPSGKGLGAAGWFLRQNVRLAFFADVAGAYQIPVGGIQSGIRWAPGLGIRFVRGNFALKLDWAYGQGHGQSGAGHGRTDMSVVENGAF
jgi:Omp85 superfamily domain